MTMADFFSKGGLMRDGFLFLRRVAGVRSVCVETSSSISFCSLFNSLESELYVSN